MASTDRQEKVEQSSENENERQEIKKINSDSEIDIFAGEAFKRPEKETEAGSAESSSGNVKKGTGSQIDIATGELFEDSRVQRRKQNTASGTLSGTFSEEKGHQEKKKPELNRENLTVQQRNLPKKGKFSLWVAVGVILLVGLGFIGLKYDFFVFNNKKSEKIPERKVFPIPRGESIAFDSFIVPFEKNERFTYITLSIVISIPNKELRNEISRKRDHIRGILYEAFIDEINRENRIPAIGHLKETIIRTVNRVLAGGMVKEVFVTQFLAV